MLRPPWQSGGDLVYVPFGSKWVRFWTISVQFRFCFGGPWQSKKNKIHPDLFRIWRTFWGTPDANAPNQKTSILLGETLICFDFSENERSYPHQNHRKNLVFFQYFWQKVLKNLVFSCIFAKIKFSGAVAWVAWVAKAMWCASDARPDGNTEIQRKPYQHIWHIPIWIVRYI